MTLVLSPSQIFEKREAQGRLGELDYNRNWETKPLGELIELLNGAPFDSNRFNRDGKGMPLIRIRDVGQPNTETWFSGEYEDKYVVNAGDVLVGLDGDFRVANWHGPNALLNQRVCKLIAKSEVLDSRFMVFRLNAWLQAIWEETSATTVKHLSSKSIQQIPFPLPPLDEQRRIVATLEDHLSRLDKALAELGSAKGRLANLRFGLLDEIFTGKQSATTEPWLSTTLGEIASWSSGGTPKSSNPSYYGGSIPWCVIGDLTEANVYSTSSTITESGLHESSAKIIEPGTVMLAMYGASIGRTGVAGVPMATNQAIACAKAKSEIVINKYLHFYLQSQKRNFVSAGKGGAQPNISQGIIKAWAISVPSISEQERLVAKIHDFDARNAVTVQAISDALTLAESLRRSLLNSAFSGRLKV